jgi:Na+/melibiose symporter-like transporter
MVGTAFSLIDKVISSFGTLIIGWVLTGIGFESITLTPQTDTMFWVVLAMYFGLPAFGHLCSIIAMKWYPLDKQAHQKMNEELAARDAVEETA